MTEFEIHFPSPVGEGDTAIVRFAVYRDADVMVWRKVFDEPCILCVKEIQREQLSSVIYDAEWGSGS